MERIKPKTQALPTNLFDEDNLSKIKQQGNFDKFEANFNDPRSLYMNIQLQNLQCPRVFQGTKRYREQYPELKIDDDFMGTIDNLALEKIKERAQFSTYGLNEFGNRKTDDKVRRTLEISGERIKFDFPLPKEVLNLAPFGCRMNKTLIKLLIYQKGDFFLEHSDASRSPDHLGTLLVSLPVTHKGGELILRSGKNIHVWETQKLASKAKCGWIAFPIDILHQVKKLESGTRIVLQYKLTLTSLSAHCPKVEPLNEVKSILMQADPLHQVTTLLVKVQNLFMQDKSLDFVALVLDRPPHAFQCLQYDLVDANLLLLEKLNQFYVTKLKYMELDIDSLFSDESDNDSDSDNNNKNTLKQVIVHQMNYDNDDDYEDEDDDESYHRRGRFIRAKLKKVYVVFGSCPKPSSVYPTLFISKKSITGQSFRTTPRERKLD